MSAHSVLPISLYSQRLSGSHLVVTPVVPYQSQGLIIHETSHMQDRTPKTLTQLRYISPSTPTQKDKSAPGGLASKTILDDVSGIVYPGQSLAILGPSGCDCDV